jgi:methyltransferase (TIGR00027 family)
MRTSHPPHMNATVARSATARALQERLNMEPVGVEAVNFQPSRTSQVVALVRAELDRPHTPQGDPEAQHKLCAGMRPSSAARLRPGIVRRTRFFDEQVFEAVSTGVPQIVICGAGYDDRALRFRATGVRFFELDHPTTQADKARRLRDMRADMQELTLIPVDFRHDGSRELLRTFGHVPSQPTLFVCEGLLVYLDQQTTFRLLMELRSVAASGSTLAASLAVSREGENSNQVATTTNANRRAGRTEPWLTILPTSAYLKLLDEAGWHDVRISDSQRPETKDSQSRMVLLTARPSPRLTAVGRIEPV